MEYCKYREGIECFYDKILVTYEKCDLCMKATICDRLEEIAMELNNLSRKYYGQSK